MIGSSTVRSWSGWGQPLNIRLIILVDDDVAHSDWEQDLYRMGVPPEMEIRFADVATAVKDHATYASDPRHSHRPHRKHHDNARIAAWSRNHPCRSTLAGSITGRVGRRRCDMSS